MNGDGDTPLHLAALVENNHFTQMCSGSKAGSYLRLIDFVYHSRVIKKKKILNPKPQPRMPRTAMATHLSTWPHYLRNVKRFQGGLVFKAHSLCASLKSDQEEEEDPKS